jgi:hypothetical protein
MGSYTICGFMDWLSNMAFIQYLAQNRSFFIALAQYLPVFTRFDICVERELRALLTASIAKGSLLQDLERQGQRHVSRLDFVRYIRTVKVKQLWLKRKRGMSGCC